MDRRDLLKSLPLAVISASTTPFAYSLLVKAQSLNSIAVTDAEKNLEAIVETIIPETDSPGAIAAGVPAFIGLAIDDLMSKEDAQEFKQLQTDFFEKCSSDRSKQFHYLQPIDQINYLEERESQNDTYFNQIKYWTMYAYFTSEVGMTKALEYIPLPGAFGPCVEVTAETKSPASYF